MAIILGILAAAGCGMLVESLVNKVGATNPALGDFLCVASPFIGLLFGAGWLYYLAHSTSAKASGLYLLVIGAGFVFAGSEPHFQKEAKKKKEEEERKKKKEEGSWWSRLF